MKPKSACDNCRSRRRKCIRSQQGTSCRHCLERQLPCNLTDETAHVETGYEPVVPWSSHMLTHKSKLLPPKDLCHELISLYFRYIHVSFHILFHKPSFVAAFDRGTLPRILLYAVMGLSARFSKHESQANIPLHERGRPFTKDAERLLNLHDVSLTTIQACLLLGGTAVTENETGHRAAATESVYFGIACRMAQLLDLPNIPASTCIEQEVNRRVWWSVYETDTWSSTAVRLPKMMPLRVVQLPMGEEAFLSLPSSQPPDFTSNQSTYVMVAQPDALIAQSIRVGLSLSKIAQVNTQAASGAIEYSYLIREVELIWHELQSWEANLPANMTDTKANLAYWTERDQGNIFTFVHMNYYYFCLLLFYQFIHGSVDGAGRSPLAVQFAAKCRHAASQVCDLIHRASQSKRSELLSSLVGHVLAIASTVQLHIFLFGENETDRQDARHLLERNFQLLTLLQTYWPCIDVSFARFRAFHEACSRSQDDSHFRMDHWMLKFLLEFATEIPERRGDDGGDDFYHESWDKLLDKTVAASANSL